MGTNQSCMLVQVMYKMLLPKNQNNSYSNCQMSNTFRLLSWDKELQDSPFFFPKCWVVGCLLLVNSSLKFSLSHGSPDMCPS